MDRKKKFWLFLLLLASTVGIFWFFTGHAFPPNDDQTRLILISCLVMLGFSILFVEHFFTKPADVLASNISILLMLTPLRGSLQEMGIWFDMFYAYNIILFATSTTALFLLDSGKAANSTENIISSALKRFSVHFGNARILYGGLFVITMLSYIDTQSWEFIVLFLFASLILFCDPKKFIEDISFKREKAGNDIGEIIGVQSGNIFLTKLFTKRVPIRKFDFVQFRYSRGAEKDLYRGMIVDNYFLNQEQWVKVLRNKEIEHSLKGYPDGEILRDNVLYKIDPTDRNVDFLDRFVGIVIEGSTIQKLRFEYSQHARSKAMSEGALLTVSIRNQSVLYQVIQGITDIETLESKNESGFIVGEAVQLGVWNPEKVSFEKFGWVPEINQPVYLADKIADAQIENNELLAGSIPNTNYPCILRKSEAVTHHTAILGVTGTGKSVFARKLIRDIVASGTKVIIVDFTGEHRNKLNDLGPSLIIPAGTTTSDYKARIKSFLDSTTENTAVFEIPDMVESSKMFTAINTFFTNVFLLAKEYKAAVTDKRICVVLEEAHTIVPEWNLISDQSYKNIVNNISQIALQGRKYNVGFLVVAQRTANVAKTILTQCNTIIAFRQFDNTSSEFLANYFGHEMTKALPNLEDRTAIAVGKALKSNVPMIFKVPDITETE